MFRLDKKLVFICHPYSGESLKEIQRNIEDAEEYGKEALLEGFVPVIPHKISGLWELDSRFFNYNHDYWMNNLCLPLLRVCDIIWMCGDWSKHKGCLMEYLEASRLNKEIVVKTKVHSKKEVQYQQIIEVI